jgi:hypothetical protein
VSIWPLRQISIDPDAWTHDIESLVIVSGLKIIRDTDAGANLALYTNWQRVKDWNEQSRYRQKTQAQAEQLFNAVTDLKDGVMQWIRLRW